MNYTFIHDYYTSAYSDSGTGDKKITMESNAQCLSELIEDFEAFLLAVGYQPASIKKYIDPEGGISDE